MKKSSRVRKDLEFGIIWGGGARGEERREEGKGEGAEEGKVDCGGGLLVRRPVRLPAGCGWSGARRAMRHAREQAGGDAGGGRRGYLKGPQGR